MAAFLGTMTMPSRMKYPGPSFSWTPASFTMRTPDDRLVPDAEGGQARARRPLHLFGRLVVVVAEDQAVRDAHPAADARADADEGVADVGLHDHRSLGHERVLDRAALDL